MSQALNSVTRHVTRSVSRRTSLQSIGAAVLAAGIATRDAGAAKKKSGNTCKKKEKQRCSNDAAECRTTVMLGCSPSDPTNCAAEQECCDNCSANGFLTCVLLLE